MLHQHCADDTCKEQITRSRKQHCAVPDMTACHNQDCSIGPGDSDTACLHD